MGEGGVISRNLVYQEKGDKIDVFVVDYSPQP